MEVIKILRRAFHKRTKQKSIKENDPNFLKYIPSRRASKQADGLQNENGMKKFLRMNMNPTNELNEFFTCILTTENIGEAFESVLIFSKRESKCRAN